MTSSDETVAVLTERWLTLRDTWPCDGWDGAADARARHHRLVRDCEARLAEVHQIVGHGPFETIPAAWRPKWHRCICQATAPGGGCTGGHVRDPRHIKHKAQLEMTDQCPGGLHPHHDTPTGPGGTGDEQAAGTAVTAGRDLLIRLHEMIGATPCLDTPCTHTLGPEFPETTLAEVADAYRVAVQTQLTNTRDGDRHGH